MHAEPSTNTAARSALSHTIGCRGAGLFVLGLAAAITGIVFGPKEDPSYKLSPGDPTRIRDFCRQLSMEIKDPDKEVKEALDGQMLTTTGRMAELLTKGTLTIYPERATWLRFENGREERDPRFIAVFTLKDSNNESLDQAILIEHTGWVARVSKENSSVLAELVQWLPQGLAAKMPPPLLLP